MLKNNDRRRVDNEPRPKKDRSAKRKTRRTNRNRFRKNVGDVRTILDDPDEFDDDELYD